MSGSEKEFKKSILYKEKSKKNLKKKKGLTRSYKDANNKRDFSHIKDKGLRSVMENDFN